MSQLFGLVKRFRTPRHAVVEAKRQDCVAKKSENNHVPDIYRHFFWGLIHQSPAIACILAPNFRFAGKHGYFTDSTSQFILCGARYYLPGIGRFLTQDPSGQAGGLNLYEYCSNNPLAKIDPTGLDYRDLTDAERDRVTTQIGYIMDSGYQEDGVKMGARLYELLKGNEIQVQTGKDENGHNADTLENVIYLSEKLTLGDPNNFLLQSTLIHEFGHWRDQRTSCWKIGHILFFRAQEKGRLLAEKRYLNFLLNQKWMVSPTQRERIGDVMDQVAEGLEGM